MRYFFNVHDGQEILDDVGLELPSLDEVRNQAIIGSGELLRDLGYSSWIGECWQMSVVDETEQTVLRLDFSTKALSCEGEKETSAGLGLAA